MKTKRLLPILLATAVVAVAPAADDPATPAPRPRLTEALRQRAETTARNRTGPAATASADPGVVQLDPLEVKGSARLIYPGPQAERPTDHPFTWREGGTFLRRKGRHFTTSIGLQFNPDAGGFNILSISW